MIFVVVITDGMENASSRYTYAQVRAAVEKHRAEGWKFLFLGANIDAVAKAMVITPAGGATSRAR